jgi:hypothetical protein
MANVHEMHFSQFKNGHEQSIDCWCEPVVDWFRNNEGLFMGLVSHNDESPLHRRSVLRSRQVMPDWITTILNEIPV